MARYGSLLSPKAEDEYLISPFNPSKLSRGGVFTTVLLLTRVTHELKGLFICWLLACLTSQQHACVSQGRICSESFTCCHTEIKVADTTFYLTQSQYTDTGPTSPSADPRTPGRVATGVPIFESLVDSTPKKSRRKRDWNPGSSALKADALPLGQRGGE